MHSLKVQCTHHFLGIHHSVTNAKCIIFQHNYLFCSITLFISLQFSGTICKESLRLWSKLHRYCILNFFVVGKSLSMQGFVVWTHGTSMKLGLNYNEKCGRSWDFSCRIARAVAAAECRRMLSWRKRTPLDIKPLYLFIILW